MHVNSDGMSSWFDRDEVIACMRGAVSPCPSGLRGAVLHHFGWESFIGELRVENCGKLVRPMLCVAMAKAGRRERLGDECLQEIYKSAAAIELIHNFSLVHDDVMDGDKERRGRESVWAKYGIDTAILVGDYLLSTGLRLAASGSSFRASVLFADSIVALIDGQTDDVTLPGEGLTVCHCRGVAARKTGTLFMLACAVAAFHIDAPAETEHAMRRYGHHLGIAFQYANDRRGMVAHGGGLRSDLGVASDLRNRRLSLPIALAFEMHDESIRGILDSYYRGLNSLSEADFDHVLAVLTGERLHQILCEHIDAEVSGCERALDQLEPTRGTACLRRIAQSLVRTEAAA